MSPPRPASSIRSVSRTTALVGTTGAFCIVVLIVLVWAAMGRLFDYSKK